MADVASLRITVESSGVDRAKKSLDGLAASASNVENKSSSAMGKLSSAIKTFDASRLNEIGNSLTFIGGALTAAVTVPMVALGVSALKTSAEIEMLTANFQTMLGSAEAAGDMISTLRTMAAKTPFGVQDLAEATKTLLQFGVASEDTLGILQMLGDVSGGNAERMRSLSLVFGQISSTGRLMGQDLLQLIGNGFNPLQVISEKTGRSMAQLKKDMENGAISAQMVTDAFKSATSEGGRFYNGMETASKTLSGQWSTLKDDMAELGSSFADMLLPYLKSLIDYVSSVVQWFTSLSSGTKAVIMTIAGLASGISALVLVLGVGIKTFASFIQAYQLISTAFAAGGLINGLKSQVIQLALNAKAFVMYKIAAFAAASASQKFMMALKATGVGLVVAGIIALANALAGYIAKLIDAKKEQEEFTKIMALSLDEIEKMTDQQKYTAAEFLEEQAQKNFEAANVLETSLKNTKKFMNATPTNVITGELDDLKQILALREHANNAITRAQYLRKEGIFAEKTNAENVSEAFKGVAGSVNTVADSLAEANTVAEEFKMFADYADVKMRSFGDYMANGFYDSMMKASNMTEQTGKVMADLVSSFASSAINQSLDAFEQMGEAWADGALSLKEMKQVFASYLASLLKGLPTMFLQAGLNLIANGQWALGLGFVAAAASSAIISGYTQGKMSQAQDSDTDKNAKGGIHESLSRYAQGGAFTNSIVNTPTRFKSGGISGLMGEGNAPEAIMPLTRTSDGSLGVKTSGQDVTPMTVNINNYTDASVTTEQRRGENGTELYVTVKNLVNQMTSRGDNDVSLNNRFKLRRQGI